jgi:hypothetical protein
MEDLIFIPLQVVCSKCITTIRVSLESLDESEEVVCPKCNFVFIPDIDVKQLLELMREIEKGREEVTKL